MSGKAEQKSFTTPDETRGFDYGALDLLQIGGAEIGRLTLQPGWRWSEHVKPIAGTDWCEAPHFQYHLQGTLRIQMADGSQFDAVAGDVTALPQGHDAVRTDLRAQGVAERQEGALLGVPVEPERLRPPRRVGVRHPQRVEVPKERRVVLGVLVVLHTSRVARPTRVAQRHVDTPSPR